MFWTLCAIRFSSLNPDTRLFVLFNAFACKCVYWNEQKWLRAHTDPTKGLKRRNLRWTIFVFFRRGYQVECFGIFILPFTTKPSEQIIFYYYPNVRAKLSRKTIRCGWVKYKMWSEDLYWFDVDHQLMSTIRSNFKTSLLMHQIANNSHIPSAASWFFLPRCCWFSIDFILVMIRWI